MKLGELFVDLGVNTGNAFNTLSGFAFKFNQLVEAAKTVSGYLDEMFGKTSKYAYDMKILSQASSVPIKTLQAMNIAARNSNTSIQNMVGHIKKLNEGILKFRTGDGSLLSQLSPLGITSDDILTAKNGYELMDKVVRRIQDIPDEFIKTSFLSSFMPIEDFNAYVDMLENKEYYEKRAESLTKQEIENLSRLYQINKEIDQKSEDRYNKFVSKTAPMMIDFKLKISDIKDEFYTAIESANSFGEAVSGAVDIATKHLGDLWKNISLNIDESGFLTEVGNNLVTVFGTVVDILIDSVRAVGHFAKAIGRLFKGDFMGAIQAGEDFFNGSKIGARYNKIVGGESVIEGKATGKSISGVRSISDEDMARNQRIASAFFKSKGYNESSIRAWVGNLTHESWFDPSQLGDNGASFG
ncbi:MAG: hypothetical protein UE295_12025, partial [Acutalibacteraceae bacterium]|nr:hypothetical protein [Acutalibacteraceae bacterium]